jgi:hypothetical protein
MAMSKNNCALSTAIQVYLGKFFRKRVELWKPPHIIEADREDLNHG